MANEQKLKATVTADITSYESNLKRASQIAKEEARKMEGAFSGSGGGGFLSGALSVATGGIIQSALSAIGGGILDVVKKGFAMNDMFERSQIAFETLLGSSSAASAHIKELANFAQNTSFQFPEVLIGSQRLQAMGFAAKDVIPALTAIGDATAGVAGGSDVFNRIILALSEMKTSGKIGGEQIRQLALTGIPAMKMLADSVGMTEKQFQKLAEKGVVNADAGIDILIKGLEKKYHGMQDRFSKETYSGIASNLEDRISMLASLGTKGAFDQMKVLMTQGLDVLGSTKFEAVLATISEKSKATGEVVNDMFKTLTGGGLVKEFKEATITSDIPILQSGLDKMSQVGSDISKGLAIGINAGSNPVLGAINSLIDMVVGTSKDKLQAHSRSEVFFEEGKDITAGITEGVQAGTEAAIGATATMADKVATVAEKRVEKLYQRMLDLRNDPKVKALLDAIGASEGAGYHTQYGGGSFDSLDSKPRNIITKGYDKSGNPLSSSAAGKYQMLNKTWDSLARQLGLKDFSELSQDIGAIKLLKDSGALAKLQSGDLEGAIQKAGPIWSSLPGSPNNQNTRSESFVKDAYNASLQKQLTLTGGSMNVFITNGAELFSFMDPSRIKSAATTGVTDLPFNTTKTSDLWNLVGIEGNLPGDARTATNLFAMMTDTIKPLTARMSEAEKAWTQFDADSKKFMTTAGTPELTTKQQQAKNRKDLGLDVSRFKPWDMAAKNFQDSFMDAIGKVNEGFKSMISTFVIDMAQGIAKIANEILAAHLAKLLFNYDGTEGSSQGSGGGWLGKILGIGIGLVGAAVGGHFSAGGGTSHLSNLPLGVPGTGVGLPLGIPGRASGGDVRAGNLYMTGERGRELFVPKGDGSIINNDTLNKMGGGRSITVVNHFHITSPDGKIAPESQRQAAERMMAALQRAA